MNHKPANSGVLVAGGRAQGANAAFILSVALFALAAVFIGLVVAVVPWWFLVPLLAVPLFVLVAWFFPPLAAVLLLAALFGVLPDALLPRIPLGGGALNAEDLGIPALILLLGLKRLGTLGSSLAPMRPYVMALGIFVLVAAVSAAIAILYRTAPIKDILNESRAYYAWLMLPLLCLAVDGERGMTQLKRLLFGLALVLAAGMIVQSLTGLALFGRGQFKELWTLDASVGGVLRSTTPGMFLMAGALIWLFAAYAFGERRSALLLALPGVLLAGGVLVGFGRGLWLAVAAGVVLLGFFARGGAFVRLCLMLALTASVGIGAVAVLKPDYASAAAERLLSVGEELDAGTSYGRRRIENEYAIARAFESPLLGVGIGGQYKPPGRESFGWEGESRYIHNSYVNILAKLGAPGLVTVLVLVGTMLMRTWSNLRQTGADRALAFTAFWCMLSTTVVTAFTQPNLASPNGVASIALALFLSETVRRAQKPMPAGPVRAGYSHA